MDFLIWVLTAYGITNGVVTSKLADPIRSWFIRRGYKLNSDKTQYSKNERLSLIDKTLFKIGEMLICIMCFGFWVGLFLSFWFSPTGFILLDAFLASGVCWIIHSIVFQLMLRYGKV